MQSEIENKEKKENSAISEIQKPEKICQSSCRICSSNFIEEIHKLRNAGRQLSEIVEIIKKEHDYTLSESSLSRHFKNWRDRQMLISARIMNGEAVEQATKHADHAVRIVGLIDNTITILENRFKLANYVVDISDLEKLMKLRYQVLAGELDDENDINATLKRAMEKHGFNMNQLVLLK